MLIIMSFIFSFPYDLDDFESDLEIESGNEFLEGLRNSIKSLKDKFEFNSEHVQSMICSI